MLAGGSASIDSSGNQCSMTANSSSIGALAATFVNPFLSPSWTLLPRAPGPSVNMMSLDADASGVRGLESRLAAAVSDRGRVEVPVTGAVQ